MSAGCYDELVGGVSVTIPRRLVEELERRGIDVGSFNSIEWIPIRVASTHQPKTSGRSFNSIEWIHSSELKKRIGYCVGSLSIPLNGFCTITVYVHCGNLLISIIWILFY